MTLSISPTRSGLTTTIVCKACEHGENQGEPVWTDSNEDTYFQGEGAEALRRFINRHGDEDYPDHPVEAASDLDAEGVLPIRSPGLYVCKHCDRPIRPSDNDPWTWQHA